MASLLGQMIHPAVVFLSMAINNQVYVLKYIYLKGRSTYRKGERLKRQICYILVCSLNAHRSQDGAKLKPAASRWVMGSQRLSTTDCFPGIFSKIRWFQTNHSNCGRRSPPLAV